MTDIKPTRRNRRLLIILLSDAGNLTLHRIWRLSGTTSGRTWRLLTRLYDDGWVVRYSSPALTSTGLPGQFVYRLTVEGRAKALRLLRLTDGR